MTKEEKENVRKGLEVCGDLMEDGMSVDCNKCPYYAEDGARCDQMAREALQLIGDLEEENQRNQDEISRQGEVIRDLEQAKANGAAEIQALKDENQRVAMQSEKTMQKMMDAAKRKDRQLERARKELEMLRVEVAELRKWDEAAEYAETCEVDAKELERIRADMAKMLKPGEYEQWLGMHYQPLREQMTRKEREE